MQRRIVDWRCCPKQVRHAVGRGGIGNVGVRICGGPRRRPRTSAASGKYTQKPTETEAKATAQQQEEDHREFGDGGAGVPAYPARSAGVRNYIAPVTELNVLRTVDFTPRSNTATTATTTMAIIAVTGLRGLTQGRA